MKKNDEWYSCVADVITVYVYVQPGAKSTAIVGLHDGALKIQLNTPPVEGRANEALRKYLAELFAVSKRQVELLHGSKARRKTLKIKGSIVDPQQIYSNVYKH